MGSAQGRAMCNKASTKRMIEPSVAVMATMDRLDLLRALLRGPCQVTNVDRKRFARGHATTDEVIVTHRMTLNEAARGYEIFNDKQESCRKVVLRPA